MTDSQEPQRIVITSKVDGEITVGQYRKALETAIKEPDTEEGQAVQVLVDAHMPLARKFAQSMQSTLEPTFKPLLDALSAIAEKWKPEMDEIEAALEEYPEAISEERQRVVSVQDMLTFARAMKSLRRIPDYSFDIKERFSRHSPGRPKYQSTIDGLKLIDEGKTSTEAFAELVKRGTIKIKAKTGIEYQYEYETEEGRFKERIKKARSPRLKKLESD